MTLRAAAFLALPIVVAICVWPFVQGQGRNLVLLGGGAGFVAGLGARVAGARARRRAGRLEGRLDSVKIELQDQLEALSRELEQRTADLRAVSVSAAHDLRNPLNTVGLNVHLLQVALAEGDRELGATALEHIERSNRQMTQILDRMRSFSRVCFADMQREQVEMALLTRQIFRELERSEPPPAVDFQLAALPPCYADRGLTRVLLSNLLSNALEYSRERTDRRVEVGFEAGSEPTVYYVRDNGAGFDAARTEELFQPFGGEGGGIGLAVAARVAYRHGGRIWATSRPGRGACFHFRLEARRTASRGAPGATPAVASTAEKGALDEN